jgi:hypothetical protein
MASCVTSRFCIGRCPFSSARREPLDLGRPYRELPGQVAGGSGEATIAAIACSIDPTRSKEYRHIYRIHWVASPRSWWSSRQIGSGNLWDRDSLCLIVDLALTKSRSKVRRSLGGPVTQNFGEGDGASVSTLASTDSTVRTRALREPERAAGVVAVAIERGDGTCSLLRAGASASWPSIGEAKSAVESSSAGIIWREATPGVWTARADGSEPPALDRSYGHGRRSEPAKSTRAAAQGDTYMAALVFRGTARSGHASAVSHRPRVEVSA